jgi:hypothetical protein
MTRCVLSELAEDPDERGEYSLIVTTPPYYGHRIYGKDLNL